MQKARVFGGGGALAPRSSGLETVHRGSCIPKNARHAWAGNQPQARLPDSAQRKRARGSRGAAMSISLDEITLVLGVDARHLEELRHTWRTWVRFKPELLRMPAIVFFDPEEVDPVDGSFLKEHPNLRWVPWQMA